MNILGINYTMHDASACLVRDGELVFAVAEERLSRKNKDSSFPARAIRAALDFAGITPADVDHVALSWPKPSVTFRHNVKTILKRQWPCSWQRWNGSLPNMPRRHGTEAAWPTTTGISARLGSRFTLSTTTLRML